MSERPTILVAGNSLKWQARTVNSAGVLEDSESTVSLRIWKNGVEQPNEYFDDEDYSREKLETGVYQFEYPPPETPEEGDIFTFEEKARFGGVDYKTAWHCVAVLPNKTASFLAAISSGGVVVENVLPGGIIAMVKGDAHTKAAGNAIELVQDDPDEVLFDQLKDGSVTALVCGFRHVYGNPGEITGTIDPDDITHDAETGKTTIVIEVAADDTSTVTVEEWLYDVRIWIGDDTPVTVITGSATVREANAKDTA